MLIPRRIIYKKRIRNKEIEAKMELLANKSRVKEFLELSTNGEDAEVLEYLKLATLRKDIISAYYLATNGRVASVIPLQEETIENICHR